MKTPITCLGIYMGCSKSNGSTNLTVNSIAATNIPTIANQLKFTGNGFANNGLYPKLYTCDSLGISPGLQWSNAPTTTNSYALTMHTIPPTVDKYVYMVLYNIPANIIVIQENSKSIGTFGINTVDKKTTYTPPCSQRPVAKIYLLTLYALNAPPTINVSSTIVTMDILSAGMKNKIVNSVVMSVIYKR